MQFHAARKGAAAAAVALATLGVGAISATAAHAATPATFTAVTHVTNRPDSGNGGTWAYDDIARTLTVTVAAVQDPADTAAGLTDYTATVADKGTFTAITGADAPNQSTAGAKVTHAVTGTIAGSIAYTVTAPSSGTLTGTVPATENDDYSTTAADYVSTSAWPTQAFANDVKGVVVTEGAWSWTYKTAAETWTDSSANGDGNLAADGNITGKVTPVPLLSHGQAQYWAPTREQVKYTVSDATAAIAAGDYFMFTIVGPHFTGQHGWVPVTSGVNTAYYEGLAAGHGYTVFYTLVAGKGSTTPVAGSVNARIREGRPSAVLPYEGYVYFVSNTHYGS